MTKSMNHYGVHWFRRDLRVAGNPALQKNWKLNKGKVVGVFCFDKKFLSRADFSVNRFQFFIESLKELKKEMRQIGSDLLFLDTGPLESFDKLFNQLKQHQLKLPTTFSWNKDYEPFARERDTKIETLLNTWDIEHFSKRDHLLIEPNEVFKPSNPNEAYKVFTPFSRQWLNVFKSAAVQQRIDHQKPALSYLETLNKTQEKIFDCTWDDITEKKLSLHDSLEEYDTLNKKNVTVPIPAAGSAVAYAQLKNYASSIDTYKDNRDFPAINGTSKFSMYLKNGSLTSSQIIAYFDLNAFDPKQKSNRDTFFNELIWREFYYHILYHFPYAEKQAFKEDYQSINWENDEQLFEAWKNGNTGFPIIDAAMKQLNTTGWMHNRCRMIVASFLCKDLLIDWRWGERYFMETLLDGDLAPNNGGWQWAASTGCDAQPYFRIFNPWSQSKKFDLNGDYIKAYIPELRNKDAKIFHDEQKIVGHYKNQIVEHKAQREKALKMYKEIKS